ncbi:MAG: tetratricopeptide repeat protein [Deltaproteobacteria bacterium]|nr:tetratricopeptide repeat protein [Deltaproteobacteria bacterium]
MPARFNRLISLIAAALAVAICLPAAAEARRDPYTGWKAEVEAHLANGEFDQALTKLKAAEAAEQTDADYHFLLAKAHSSLNRLDDAARELEIALQQDPKFIEAMGHKAVLLLRVGKTDEALATASAAIDIEPTGELHYARGAIQMARGDLKAAIADLDAAIGLEPANDEYLVARGEVDLRVGRVAEAEKDYGRALTVNPKNAKAYLGRGGLMMVKRDCRAARIDLDRCIELAPKYSSCYLRRGKLFQMREDPERAYQDYLKAVEYAPESTEAWFERVMSELELGKFADAETSSKELLKREDSARTHKVIGMVYAARGRPTEARDEFTKALAQDDGDAETYYLRGSAHAMAEDFDGAVADFDASIARNKRYLDPLRRQGGRLRRAEAAGEGAGSLQRRDRRDAGRSPHLRDAFRALRRDGPVRQIAGRLQKVERTRRASPPKRIAPRSIFLSRSRIVVNCHVAASFACCPFSRAGHDERTVKTSAGGGMKSWKKWCAGCVKRTGCRAMCAPLAAELERITHHLGAREVLMEPSALAGMAEAEEAGPWADAVHELVDRALIEGLPGLTVKQLAVLSMTLAEGATTREIAERLRLPQSTVCDNLKRARRIARRHLRGQFHARRRVLEKRWSRGRGKARTGWYEKRL